MAQDYTTATVRDKTFGDDDIQDRLLLPNFLQKQNECMGSYPSFWFLHFVKSIQSLMLDISEEDLYFCQEHFLN